MSNPAWIKVRRNLYVCHPSWSVTLKAGVIQGAGTYRWTTCIQDGKQNYTGSATSLREAKAKALNTAKSHGYA